MTIEEMLEEEIKRTLEDLKTVESGSAAAKDALVKLEKLHSQHIKELETALKKDSIMDAAVAKVDENRIRSAELDLKVREANEALEVKKAELAQKEAELQEAKRGRRWKTVLDILGITVPVGATGYWIFRGLKFEEEGKIYSSRTPQWVSGLTRMFRKGG